MSRHWGLNKREPLYKIKTEFGELGDVSRDDAEMFAGLNAGPANFDYEIIEQEPAPEPWPLIAVLVGVTVAIVLFLGLRWLVGH